MRWSYLSFLLIGFPSLALACQCEPLADEERRDLATYVFSGTVSDAGKDKAGESRIAFDVGEVFKGDPKSEMEVIDVGKEPGCAIEVKEGENWMVYVRWQWGNKVTSRCFGTKRIENAKGDLKTLGPAESWKLKQYPKLQAGCMGKKQVPCCLNSVKTMAAGGYLPEPEEGCPEGMIPDRLKCPTSYVWCVPFQEAPQR